MEQLKENEDYIIDEKTGRVIFTSLFHLKRGTCCGNGCKNCAFEPKYQKNNKIPNQEIWNQYKTLLKCKKS